MRLLIIDVFKVLFFVGILLACVYAYVALGVMSKEYLTGEKWNDADEKAFIERWSD